MYCLKCGREYPPETEFCGDCGFLIAGERSGDKVLGAHFMQLVRAGNQMIKDEITPPLFLDILENMSRVLDKLENDLARESENPELSETPGAIIKLIEQPIGYAREGIALYRQALDLLRSYLKNSDRQNILDGLALAEKADGYFTLSAEIAAAGASELERQGIERFGKEEFEKQ